MFRPSARSVYLALALGLPSLAGCTTFLARQMVQAPNKLQTPPEKQPKLAVFFDQVRNQDFSRTAMVPVGPPPADLSIAVMPPGNADAEYHASVTRHEASMQFQPGKLRRYSSRPMGTIVLLPAFQNGKFMMLPWASVLAKAGYQCVLVDLRGEGLSTGNWITWGDVESRDVQQLIRWLNTRNIVYGPLVLMGVSYGATVALRAAALDSQVRAVVAIEPFMNAVDVIHRGGRIMYLMLSYFVSNARMDEAVKAADRLADTRLEAATALPAASSLDIPVLYIYGGKDRFVPATDQQELISATRHAEHLGIPAANHMTLPIEFPKYQQPVLDWLARTLNNESAPPPR